MSYKMPEELQLLENWLHKNTGLEFAGWSNGVYGLQCTNPKQYKKFITKQRKTLK